jgi:hypothetical protein
MKFILLDRETKEIIHRYEADKLTPHGGKFSNALHVEVPEELKLESATLELNEEAPIIYEEFERITIQEQGETEFEIITREEIVPTVTVKGVISGIVIDHEAEAAQAEQKRINAESLAYLASTDFYIIREADSGVPCPPDVKIKRQEARERIVK